ncbi:sugar transferase [Gordonia desulfuricans]|uniref:sugar transferase n=1 Tax=Gordonia desulfuricans TaxID=89051 RepID=UPI001FD1449D|nr:sugar transferase [Gordonia desulfuricans]
MDSKRRPWVDAYLRKVACSDVVIIALSLVIAQFVRFGSPGLMAPHGPFGIPALLVCLTLGVVWAVALRLVRTYDSRIVGAGAQEYSRIVTASVWVFGGLAILDLLFHLNIARGFLAVALPVGTLGLLTCHRFWRHQLHRRRVRGSHLDDLLIVGSSESALPLAKRVLKDPSLGYRVVGLCTPPGRPSAPASIAVAGHIVPVINDVDAVSVAVRQSCATAVAVSSTDEFGYEALRELSWELETDNIDLMVSPGVVDVTGPRMLVRQVDGLPLLHIDKPRYGAAQSLLKSTLDYALATTVLIILTPVMIVTALAIKSHDGGPVFFRHLRVGKDGQTFRVWKFRSMATDADKRIGEAREKAPSSSSVFYKSEHDPRITPIGRFIRKTSIDELPQLFNVLARQMSIVGPRPLVPGEGSEIPNFVERRLLVKPGITGLWQVSGRSNLAEEDRIRLDLVYVENWTMVQDLVILWRTVKAVIAKDGAY